MDFENLTSSRRSIIALVLGAGIGSVSLATTKDIHVKTTKKLLIASPKDVFVTKWLKATNDHVKENDAICELDTSEAEMRLSTLLNLQSANTEQQAFIKAVFDNREIPAQRDIDTAKAYLDYAEKLKARDEMAIALKMITPLAFSQTYAAWQKAWSEHEKAIVALHILTRTRDNALKQAALAEKELIERIDSAKKQVQLLTLKSPVAGKLSQLIPENAFVQLGSAVAEIELI